MSDYYDEPSTYSEDYDEITSKLEKKRLTNSRGSTGGSSSKPLAQFGWKDWNNELQSLLALEETYSKYKAISDLSTDFVFAASLYARIIISEYELPIDQKTIRPSHVGGVAGGPIFSTYSEKTAGTKFYAHGILFKFALDNNQLYGKDAFAMKAASSDLRGLNMIADCHVPSLHLPMMCLIDYRGFRVVAMSVLPIEGDATLIYGSSNAGKDVKNSDQQFSKQIDQVASILNLKRHVVGANEQIGLVTPVDLEGHLSRIDKRYYLLDFSRLMPPQVKLKQDISSCKTYLFEFLRPELVKSNRVPLSSDALTPLGKFDSNFDAHNSEVIEACKRLFTQVIPKFATAIEAHPLNHGCQQLVTELHLAGINLRQLGFVRRLVKVDRVRSLILTEMAARAMKDDIYEQLRKTMKEVKVATEEPFKVVVLDYLNRVFYSNSTDFWARELKQKLNSKFLFALSDAENALEFNLADLIDFNTLIDRLDYLAALKLRTDSLSVLASGTSELVASDIKELGCRVRMMNLVNHSTAYTVAIEAHSRQGSEAVRLYTRAQHLFTEVAARSPFDKLNFYRWGWMLKEMSHLRIFSAISLRLAQEATVKFKKALELDPHYHDALLGLTQIAKWHLVHPSRLHKIYLACFTKQQIATENGQLYNDIASAFNKIIDTKKVPEAEIWETITNDLEGDGDSDQNGNGRLCKVRDSDLNMRLAIYTQASKIAPVLITPCLKYMASMKKLKLYDCPVVSNETLLLLARNCPDLIELELHNSYELDNTTLTTILEYTSLLKKLSLIACEKVTALKFPPAIYNSLEELEVAQIRVADDGLASVDQRFSKTLKSIRFGGLEEVTDLSLTRLAEALPSLQKLILNKYSQEDTGSSSYLYHIKSPVLSTLTNLQSLGLSGCKDITSIAFQNALRSPHLTELSLGGCFHLEDSVSLMTIAKRVTSLTRLVLSHTNITNSTLKAIALANAKSLRTLALSATELHPECFECLLTNCTALTSLRAGYWRTSATIEEITQAFRFLALPSAPTFPNLVDLELASWSNLQTNSLVSLVSRCPNLTILDVANCHLLEDALLMALGGHCQKLKELYLTNLLLVKDAGIVKMARNCLELEVIHILNMASLTDKSFVALSGCKNLIEVQANGIKTVTNLGLQTLVQHCPRLKVVSVRNCKLITSDFVYYKLRHNCPKLKILIEVAKQKSYALYNDLQL